MQKFIAILSVVLCITVMTAGCTGPGTSFTPPASTPAISGGSSGYGGQVIPCTVAASQAGASADNLEILNAEGTTMVNNVLLIGGSVRNKGGERVASGLNGRSCDTITGRCAEDHVSAVILEPYETVELNLVTMDGCPTSGTASTCTCEVWFAILR
jgi:hypothetical protein